MSTKELVNQYYTVRRSFIALYKSQKFQKLIQDFTEKKEIKQIEDKLKDLLPSKSFLKSCEAQSTILEETKLSITLFGSSKSGKSTLGNILMGENIFESTNVRTNNFKFSVHSSPITSSPTFTIKFDSIIKSEDDIRIALSNLNDPDAVSFFIELYRQNDQPFQEKKVPKWRQYITEHIKYENPIIREVNIQRPIFDINEAGFILNDLSNCSPSDFYYKDIIKCVLESSVIVYVFNASTIFNNQNEILILKNLIRFGADVIFLFNRHDDYTEEEVENTKNELKMHLNQNNIEIIDINLQKDPKNQAIRKKIVEKLIDRSKRNTSLFLNYLFTFFKLIYLLVSRIVNVYVDNQLKSKSNIANDINQIRKDTSELLVQINTLQTTFKNKIKDIETGYDALVSKKLNIFQSDIESKLLDLEVPIAFEPQNRTILSQLVSNREFSAYEKYIWNYLEKNFSNGIVSAIENFLYKEKGEFMNQLLTEASKIFKILESLKSHVLKSVAKINTDAFVMIEGDIKSIESNIINAIPMTMTAIGVVGTTALGISILIGALASSFISMMATGGVAILGIAGISGIATRLIMSSSPSNEKDTKLYVLSKFMKEARQIVYSKEIMRLNDLEMNIKQTTDFLRLHVHEIGSLLDINVYPKDMDFTKLCQYLEMKETVLSFNESLHNLILKSQLNFNTKDWFKYKMNSKFSKYCYVCESIITKCHHLCQRCDYLYGGDNCIYCNERIKWLSNKEANFDTSQIQAILKELPPSTNEFISSLNISMKKVIRPSINDFCIWFMKTFNSESVDNYVQMKNSLNAFIFKIIECYGRSNDQMETVKIIHETIFNTLKDIGVGTVFRDVYRRIFKDENIEYVRLCSKYEPFVEERRMDKYKACTVFMKKFEEEESPVLKFEAIKEMLDNLITSSDASASDVIDLLRDVYTVSKNKYMISDINLLKDCLEPFATEGNQYILVTVFTVADRFDVVYSDMQKKMKEKDIKDEESTIDLNLDSNE